MIVDLVVMFVIALAVMVAVLYIRNQKKKGVTCIGCPHAGTCAKKSQGGCSSDLQ